MSETFTCTKCGREVTRNPQIDTAEIEIHGKGQRYVLAELCPECTAKVKHFVGIS